jgi:hypothetical protein
MQCGTVMEQPVQLRVMMAAVVRLVRARQQGQVTQWRLYCWWLPMDTYEIPSPQLIV